jgi:hypothetical protein
VECEAKVVDREGMTQEERPRKWCRPQVTSITISANGHKPGTRQSNDPRLEDGARCAAHEVRRLQLTQAAQRCLRRRKGKAPHLFGRKHAKLSQGLQHVTIP